MEEFKGTKGEWESRGYYSNGYIVIDFPKGSIIVYERCTNSMNDEEKQKHIEESEANAKLIAASPTLLHRLNSLILSVKAHPDYVFGEDGDEWHDLISLSEEAINKALK